MSVLSNTMMRRWHGMTARARRSLQQPHLVMSGLCTSCASFALASWGSITRPSRQLPSPSVGFGTIQMMLLTLRFWRTTVNCSGTWEHTPRWLTLPMRRSRWPRASVTLLAWPMAGSTAPLPAPTWAATSRRWRRSIMALTVLREAQRGLAQATGEAAELAIVEAIIYEQLRQLPEAQRAARFAAEQFARQAMPIYSAGAALQAARIAIQQQQARAAQKLLALATAQAQ